MEHRFVTVGPWRVSKTVVLDHGDGVRPTIMPRVGGNNPFYNGKMIFMTEFNMVEYQLFTFERQTEMQKNADVATI